MEISFDIRLSGFLFFGCLLFAIGISLLVYFRHRENQDLTNKQVFLLAAIRFVSVFFVSLLLLSPILKSHKKIKEQPVILIASDNSESIHPYLHDIATTIKKMNNNLSDNYKIEHLTFGQKALKSDTVIGTEKTSDYSQLLSTIKNEYINRNIGGLILIGDGIFNRGQNPLDMINSVDYSIYSLAVGDTVSMIDARIEKIRTNKSTYLANRFPVEIETKFLMLKGRNAVLEIFNNNKIVHSQSINILNDNYFKALLINLEAENRGLQHYIVKIRPLDGETAIENNSSEFVINVLQNKQHILAISNGPHPDLGAIKNTLEQLKNYELDIVTGNVLPDSIEKYNLLILNQVPSLKNTSLKLTDKLLSIKVPLLFIIGVQSHIPQINDLNLGLNISYKNNTEETQVSFNNEFSLFTLSEDCKEIIGTASPLLAPYGNTRISSDMYNLANQNIKNIVTNNTSVAMGIKDGRKIGFIVGEGIWRWRLFNYQQTKNHDAFDELIRKIIQYLASKENEDNFTIYYSFDYLETDNLEMTAELLNDNYELVNKPDIQIKLWNDSVSEYNYVFDRLSDHYYLNAGTFPVGDYHFEAKTVLGDKEYSEFGDFSILRMNQENQNKTADFNLLYQLSERTGGLFKPIEQSEEIIRSIQDNKHIQTLIYKQTSISEMMNLKWIFGIIVLLFGLEWFLRKYWGIY